MSMATRTGGVSPPPNKKRKLNSETMSPISRVIHCENYFQVLELPCPKLDDLERVTWTTQKDQIKKHYFKISRQVHPDRHNQNQEQSKRAAMSFDIVQRSFETLHDNIKREKYVNEYGEKLKYKASKTKFDVKERNDNEILTLEQQNEMLEKSQNKRLKQRALIEEEADKYAKDIIDNFNEKRKTIEMNSIRMKQNRKLMQNARNNVTQSSDDSDTDNDDSDVEYEKTLSKLKHTQNKSKRRFR